MVLDGEPGSWLPGGFEVTPQAEGGLALRLADAFAGIAGPALLVGMDTPQVTVDLLSDGLRRLGRPDTDAVLGRCPDGGYWSIGFDGRREGAFDGVPMSTERTAAVQLRRLRELAMSVEELPVLRDVDHFSDAVAVAADHPEGRFASKLAELELSLA